MFWVGQFFNFLVIINFCLPTYCFFFFLGVSANAISHNINYASEIPTFGEFAEVNSSGCAMDKSRSGGTTLMIVVDL